MKRAFIVLSLLVLPLIVRSEQWAIVSVSVTDMKRSPDYQSETVSQAILGTPVQVTGSEGYWYAIVTPEGYRGWTTRMNIFLTDDSSFSQWKKSRRVIMTDHYGIIRSGPDSSSEVISDCVMGSVLESDGSEGEYCRIILPDGRKGFLPSSAVCGFRERMLSGREAGGEDIVSLAQQFMGFPYLWGGLSPKGFDCSGLVKLCYFMNGLVLPRDAKEQIMAGCSLDISDIMGNLLPGDLVFFGNPATSSRPQKVTHVGIYIGGGDMIHSSLTVRTNSLLAGEKDYYSGKKLLGAVRIIGCADPVKDVVPVLEHPWYF